MAPIKIIEGGSPYGPFYGLLISSEKWSLVEASGILELLSQSEWDSYSGYSGDLDEGDFVSLENGEKLTQKIEDAFHSIPGISKSHSYGVAYNLSCGVEMFLARQMGGYEVTSHDGAFAAYEGKFAIVRSKKVSGSYGRRWVNHYAFNRVEGKWELYLGYKAIPEKFFYSKEELEKISEVQLFIELPMH